LCKVCGQPIESIEQALPADEVAAIAAARGSGLWVGVVHLGPATAMPCGHAFEGDIAEAVNG
jgi:hypothetical protein